VVQRPPLPYRPLSGASTSRIAYSTRSLRIEYPVALLDSAHSYPASQTVRNSPPLVESSARPRQRLRLGRSFTSAIACPRWPGRGGTAERRIESVVDWDRLLPAGRASRSAGRRGRWRIGRARAGALTRRKFAYAPENFWRAEPADYPSGEPSHPSGEPSHPHARGH
jgi:hypothetical protein